MKNLNNKVVAITGAGAGIGRALAIGFAKHGSHLALGDINQSGLEETQRLLNQYPVKVSIHQVDVRSKENLFQFAEDTVTEHGKVNVLINNAGITLQKQFSSHTIEDLERVIDINLYGVIYGCKAFLPHLRKADGAHIINMSSMAGFMGLPVQSSYCTTKAAVKAFSESLYTELKCEGIGVTSVHPGAIKTDIMKATLNESDDIETARKTMDLAMKFALPVDVAANKIINAVLKNKQRLLIGKDSIFFEIFKRVLPTSSQKLMAYAFSKFKPA
ncbi:MAG: SDR family oxidoreductase [Pseudomonadales bacterium]|nr:SDR family oxidoreductase [Pseudomonadales bacterium]